MEKTRCLIISFCLMSFTLGWSTTSWVLPLAAWGFYEWNTWEIQRPTQGCRMHCLGGMAMMTNDDNEDLKVFETSLKSTPSAKVLVLLMSPLFTWAMPCPPDGPSHTLTVPPTVPYTAVPWARDVLGQQAGVPGTPMPMNWHLQWLLDIYRIYRLS